jgi:transposase
MKSKDLQQVFFCKYEDGDGPTKIFRDLNGSLGLATIKRWCKMIRDTGAIQLSTPPGGPRFARTSKTIQKVKHKLDQKKMVSVRRLAKEYNISKSNAHRILKEDLGLHTYKMTMEPRLTDEHKNKRKKIINWIVKNFRKEDTMRILFSDEKMFDLDGIYNSQNECIWAVSLDEADKKRWYQNETEVSSKGHGLARCLLKRSDTISHSRSRNSRSC